MIDLSELRDADATTARGFLESAPAERVVAAIRATTDDDLLAVLDDVSIRTPVVEVILQRLHEYAVRERVAALHGVVRFDLSGRDGEVERHFLEFRNGRILRPDEGDPPADVVLTTSALGFVRLVAGQRNAGLEYLAGTLDIDGDAALALGVGGIFVLPGTHRVAVDPTALDPVDVATALAGVSSAHLRAVMASDFRPVVLREIFRRLPDFLHPRRSRGVNLAVGFRLLGNPTGVVEEYVVRVRDGVATVEGGDPAGEQAGECDSTVTCEGHDFLRLATGHLNPVVGVLKGALKVKGDKAKALKLSSIIDFPKAR